jgi:hypothetical protein
MEVSKRQFVTVLVFLLIGACVTGAGVYRRLLTDREYNTVLLLVDWHGLLGLASAGRETAPADSINRPDLWELLKALPEARVCYGEETIGSLLEQGIIRRAPLTTGGPAFEVCSERYEGDIFPGAQRHGYWLERSVATRGKLVFQVPQLADEEVEQLPVAWRQDVIDACRAVNRGPVLRPGATEFMGASGLERTLEFCGNQDLMLFQGSAALGYPHQLEQVASLLNERQQYLGWVEFEQQDGGAELAAKLLPNVLRVHSIAADELVKYTPDTAVLRLVRAVRERGIRCLYLRPFIRGDVLSAEAASMAGTGYREQLLALNQRYFSAIHEALASAGYKIAPKLEYIGGPPSSPRPAPQWLKRARPLLVLAVGAALTWLLALWFPGAPRWLWTVLLAASGLGAVGAAVLPQLLELALFAAALVFPLLGFWLALLLYSRLSLRWSCQPACPRRLLFALLALLTASAVTALGGLLIHAGLWDVDTMLKTEQFRGVTLALALPLLAVAAYAWQAETLQAAYDHATRGLQGYWQRSMALWQAPIRYGDVAFIMIALGAVGIVLLRSGNDSGLGMFNFESWFRQGLEQLFIVRPRTKELLGHPLLVVFFLSLPWRNRLSLLLVLGGMLGQVSILNTFCHLHTPLVLTLERVSLGLGLGLANGLIWGGVILLVSWLARLLTQRYKRSQPAES